jgi:TonB family protein
MISYFLAANCYGLLFYGIYLLLLKGRSSHTWSRCYLLTITMLSLVLPLVRLDMPGWYTASVAHTLQAVTLPEVTLTANGGAQDGREYTGFALVPLIYAAIAGLLLLRMLYRIITLQLFLRRQQFVQQDGYRLAMNTGIGPASFGAAILFPGKEVNLNILNHEKAHLQYGHHYDKLLMELVQCIFFAVVPLFFIRKELALVHEFEADAIAGGTDKESYAYTLLSAHLGVRQFHFLQSFFHHPLKRRIIMLQRNGPGQRHRVAKTLVLFCSILFTCAIVYAQSIPLSRLEEQLPAQWSALKVAEEPVAPTPAPGAVDKQETQLATPAAKNDAGAKTPDISVTVPPELPSGQPDQENMLQDEPAPVVPDRVFTAVEVMPQPPMENMQKYLAEHIRYPEEARKQQIQGRVVIRFVVDKEGNVANPVLQRDIGGGCGAEAMRVVRNMPKWSPGYQGGQPVDVYYTLPVSFRIENNSTPENTPHQ